MKPLKVMLSNGLKGKENPTLYVERCRRALASWSARSGVLYELLHSYRPDEYEEGIKTKGIDHTRIAMLGKTITQELAECDALVLVDDWYNYDGCTVEFEIAKRYGKPIIFVETEEYSKWLCKKFAEIPMSS